MVAKDVKQALNKNSYKTIRPSLTDPQLLAAVAKATPGQNGHTHDNKGNRSNTINNPFALKATLQKRGKKNNDAKIILSLLPDLKLAVQILVSSIISPKDMTSIELIYTGGKNVVTAELSATLVNRIKQHFEEDYKIKDKLPEILEDMLALKGSYPVVVLPENVIDDFINGQRITTESFGKLVDDDGFAKGIGILGSHVEPKKQYPKSGISVESYYSTDAALQESNRFHYSDEVSNTLAKEEYLIVTDNPIVLKMPKLIAKGRARRIKLAYSTENIFNPNRNTDPKKMNDSQIERMLYSHVGYKSDAVAALKKPEELKRNTIGSPLVIKLPSESVITVFVPGNVKEHLGYFVIIDEEGNPIESISSDQAYSGISSGMNSNSGGISGSLIQKVNTNIGDGGKFDQNSAAHIDFIARAYTDLVERDLLTRLKNGIHSSNVAVSKNDHFYRVMLSRVLAKKYTQVLFIPVEYMTYFAFDYNEEGIGKSLLDDIATICMLRCAMLFSDVVGSLKNSIGRTKINVALPEEDPNQLKTMELIIDEIVRTRQLPLPTGVSSPPEIFDFVQRAGMEFQFEGSQLPDVKISFENIASNFQKPDTELQDLLKKASIMHLGISPETVDNGFGSEFAATVLNNNVLLAKSVLTKQGLFCPQLSDHCKKIAMFDEALVKDLKQILTENVEAIKIKTEELSEIYGTAIPDEHKEIILINYVLTTFLSTLCVELPKPASVTLENQLQSFTTYSDALDKAVDAYISTSFLTDSTAGDLSSQIDTIKEIVKAHFLRKYLANNGFMSELADLTALRDDGNPQLQIFNEVTDYIASLSKSGVIALVKLKPSIQAVNKDLGDNLIPAGDGGSSETPADGEGDGLGGDDGFGDLKLDTPTGDTPPDDTPVEVEEVPPDETPPDGEQKPEEDNTNQDDKEVKEKPKTFGI